MDDDHEDGAEPEARRRDGLAEGELEQRLVYALMLPAVRMALASGMASKELMRWAELAYFHETRRLDLKTHEVAERLAISPRKVAELSRRLKDNFLSPDEEHGLPRRIEFMLWAEPLSAARIKQAFPEVPEDEVDRALATLEAQDRVRLVEGRTPRYERVRSQARLVQDQLLARIDGLNTLLGNVGDVVHARFVADEPRSFARTLAFRVREADLPRLRALYDDVLWETLRRLDADARDSSEPTTTIDLSFLWAPHDQLTGAYGIARDDDTGSGEDDEQG